MIIAWLPSEFGIVNEYLDVDFLLLDRNVIDKFIHACIVGYTSRLKHMYIYIPACNTR